MFNSNRHKRHICIFQSNGINIVYLDAWLQYCCCFVKQGKQDYWLTDYFCVQLLPTVMPGNHRT
uniref:Uncharacterized protein n=1 Tax=Arundo donax TaxID=35708 RepID=A0A0A9DJF0_ARUDO